MGVAAALSREYAAEGQAFIPALAKLLEGAMPEATEPILSGGLLSRKNVVGLRLTLGDFQYVLDGSSKGILRPSRTHIVRGIALKSEPIDIETWLGEVGAGMEELMRHNERVRGALGGLLGI